MDKMMLSLEEDEAHLKGSKYWTAALKKDFQIKQSELEKHKSALKKMILGKKSPSVEDMKEALTKAVASIKASQEFVKDHRDSLLPCPSLLQKFPLQNMTVK